MNPPRRRTVGDFFATLLSGVRQGYYDPSVWAPYVSREGWREKTELEGIEAAKRADLARGLAALAEGIDFGPEVGKVRSTLHASYVPQIISGLRLPAEKQSLLAQADATSAEASARRMLAPAEKAHKEALAKSIETGDWFDRLVGEHRRDLIAAQAATAWDELEQRKALRPFIIGKEEDEQARRTYELMQTADEYLAGLTHDLPRLRAFAESELLKQKPTLEAIKGIAALGEPYGAATGRMHPLQRYFSEKLGFALPKEQEPPPGPALKYLQDIQDIVNPSQAPGQSTSGPATSVPPTVVHPFLSLKDFEKNLQAIKKGTPTQPKADWQRPPIARPISPEEAREMAEAVTAQLEAPLAVPKLDYTSQELRQLIQELLQERARQRR